MTVLVTTTPPPWGLLAEEISPTIRGVAPAVVDIFSAAAIWDCKVLLAGDVMEELVLGVEDVVPLEEAEGSDKTVETSTLGLLGEVGWLEDSFTL